MAKQSLKNSIGQLFLGLIAVAAAVGLGWKFYAAREAEKSKEQPSTARVEHRPAVGDEPDSLELPEHAIESMHLKTTAASAPRFAKKLHLRGSLAIDPNRLSHVNSRFAGVVVELATVDGLLSQKRTAYDAPPRTLLNFDKVEQGTPLAVIWSKELGEKKSELAAALAELRKEKQQLTQYERLEKTGAISDGELKQQRLKVEQCVNNAFTARATLRAYEVSEADIRQVEESAENIHLRQETDKSYSADWPRVVVTSPITGEIVDKNVIKGDIVDANAELFQIADMSALAVYLHAYEEDLPALEQLPKPWQVWIKIPAYPEIGELKCSINRVSPMIDPNEHMALLIGTVENPSQRLKAYQAITADVGIPLSDGVVEIPANAMIDVRDQSVVYVQPDKTKPHFERRHVKVLQRFYDVVYIKTTPTDEQTAQGMRGIQIGDEVVTGGVLELEDYLQQQRS